MDREESKPKDDPLEVIQHRVDVFWLNMLQHINAADHLVRGRRLIEAWYARIVKGHSHWVIDLKVLTKAAFACPIVQDLADTKVIDQLANLWGKLYRGHPVVGVAGVQALLLGFVGFGDHIFALSFSSTYGA
jgi:hypothetical protein